MALRTSIGGGFIRFLNYNLLAAINSPSITRSFAASTTTTTKKKQQKDKQPDKHPVAVTAAPQDLKMENPFQLAGPGNVIEVNDVKNKGGALVRICMPGVGNNGYKVWTEDTTVFFMGRGDDEFEDDDSVRKYGGSLEFSKDLYKPEEVKAQMQNGILRLSVPNADGAEHK